MIDKLLPVLFVALFALAVWTMFKKQKSTSKEQTGGSGWSGGGSDGDGSKDDGLSGSRTQDQE